MLIEITKYKKDELLQHDKFIKVFDVRVQPVGFWYWKGLAADDLCGICRGSFCAPCPDCKIPGDQCPPQMGSCSHCFHKHCLTKWLLQGNEQCPMCRRSWEDHKEISFA